MSPHAVIFDFHNTLVVADSFEHWLADAAAETGEHVEASAVLPVLREVWTRAGRLYPGTTWDLDPVMHRRAFTEVLTNESPCSPQVAQALYDLMPRQWIAAQGALDILAGLTARGVLVGLLSNTAIDVRPRLAELGLLPLLDDVTPSFEEGLVKPDPRLFSLAAARLGVEPRECVYVGDNAASDGGAVGAGMTCVLVPVIDDMPDLRVTGSLLAALTAR